MEIWIARDKKGYLSLFNTKPTIGTDYPDTFFSEDDWTPEGDSLCLEDDMFPQVTWENSPKKVNIELMDE